MTPRPTKIRTYFNREMRQATRIQKQKKKVNETLAAIFACTYAKKIASQSFFSRLWHGRINPKALVIDSFRENTRKELMKTGIIKNNDIDTVDIETTKTDDRHFKIRFKEFLKNKASGILDSTKPYDVVWADFIIGPRESIDELELLFKHRLINSEAPLAVTCCPRGHNSVRRFGRWDTNIKQIAKKHGYNLFPVEVSSELRLASKNTYRIKNHMTDNGGVEKTGRTMTAFYIATEDPNHRA